MRGIPTFLLVALALVTICSLVSAILTYKMIAMVNRKLPPESQINYLFLYPGKLSRLNSSYRQFYPSGRLLFWSRLLYLAPIGWVLVALLWILEIIH